MPSLSNMRQGKEKPYLETINSILGPGERNENLKLQVVFVFTVI